MEFNILSHFKGLNEMPTDPLKADEIGTSLLLTGNMGPQISKKMDEKAKAAGMSRRNFMKSSLGFSAAMLAANEVTGMTRRALVRWGFMKMLRSIWPKA